MPTATEPKILKGAEWVRRGKLIDSGTPDQRAAWARAGHQLVCCIVEEDRYGGVLFFYVNGHGSPDSPVLVEAVEKFRLEWEPLQ